MKTKSIPSAWIYAERNRRFDVQPYISGAVEARVAVERTGLPKDILHTLTKGHDGGIYNGPHFSRVYVNSREYGVPFLSGGSILNADLSHLPLLRKKDAFSSKLSYLEVFPGMTLISCSGTIGRTVFARSEMAGMWASQDVMKVVPDPDKIPPGYLFAFLHSSFGVPLVVSGTYGSIIQHIEPEHIRDLAVPRLGAEREAEVHALVQSAADDRSEARRILDAVKAELQEELGLSEMPDSSVTGFSITTIPTSRLDLRFDAHYHCAKYAAVAEEMENGPFPFVKIGDVLKEHFWPPIFKRIWVDGDEYGSQFISGIDAYKFESDNPRFVSRQIRKFDRYILRKGWLIFQGAGQIYGLFGRPLYVHGWLEDIFGAPDLYRLVPHTQEDGAYLFAFFSTSQGQVLIKRLACGDSIPRVMEPQINGLWIPWPPAEVRARYAIRVIKAHELLDRALQSERQAIAFVESSIRETV